MLLNKNEVDYRYTMSEIVAKFPFVKEQQMIRKKIYVQKKRALSNEVQKEEKVSWQDKFKKDLVESLQESINKDELIMMVKKKILAGDPDNAYKNLKLINSICDTKDVKRASLGQKQIYLNTKI